MIPCISQATTLSTAFEADLSPYARAGFTAVEIWLTKLETYLESHSIDEAKAGLAEQGLTPMAAATQGGLLASRGGEREAHWAHFRRRLGWMTDLAIPVLVVAADPIAAPTPDDYRLCVASLAEAEAVAADHGVRIALEFQSKSGLCSCLETAIALLGEAGTTRSGVCLDLFHYYTGPSKAEDLDHLARSNLAWVQLSDLSGTPREIAGDSDRVLPGDGDFRLGPIVDRLAEIGYDGGVSVELLNPSLWAIPPGRVADFGHQSLLRVLGARATPRPDGGS